MSEKLHARPEITEASKTAFQELNLLKERHLSQLPGEIRENVHTLRFDIDPPFSQGRTGIRELDMRLLGYSSEDCLRVGLHNHLFGGPSSVFDITSDGCIYQLGGSRENYDLQPSYLLSNLEKYRQLLQEATPTVEIKLAPLHQ